MLLYNYMGFIYNGVHRFREWVCRWVRKCQLYLYCLHNRLHTDTYQTMWWMIPWHEVKTLGAFPWGKCPFVHPTHLYDSLFLMKLFKRPCLNVVLNIPPLTVAQWIMLLFGRTYGLPIVSYWEFFTKCFDTRLKKKLPVVVENYFIDNSVSIHLMF